MLSVDRARRTIEGRVAAFDVIGYRPLALPLRYPFGSLTWGRYAVKLLVEHNHALRVGQALELTELEDGVWGVFAIAHGDRGDQALELAATTHGEMSIGVADDEWRIASDGVEECVTARIIEVSLTANPVFRQGVS